MASVLRREEARHRAGAVNVKPEVAVMCLQAEGVKDGRQPSEAGAEARGRGGERTLPRASQRYQCCQHLDLGLLNYRPKNTFLTKFLIIWQL